MPQVTYIKTLALAIFSIFLVSTIIFFPKEAFESSIRGLTIWWDVVFPALLPFFFTAELLMGFGVVHFFGVLLEPFMRPLFRVPGVGGFVMSMGLASGNPMGAKLTVNLREKNMITQEEGERLVSIASTSGPLFMIGAVAVGFFHDAKLGLIIALSHYLAALCVGLFMRFHEYQTTVESKPVSVITNDGLDPSKNIFYRALQAMHHARLQDGRTIGTLMKESIHSSIQTLFILGGFIIMFSVLMNILEIVHITHALTILLSVFLVPLGFNPELVSSLIAGVFEMTLGAQMSSEAGEHIPLLQKVALASAVIAWGGLSVHAQVISLLSSTDIRYFPYLLARLLHGLLAGVWTLLLWGPIHTFLFHEQQPVFSPIQAEALLSWDRYSTFSFSLFLLFIILFIISSVIYFAKQKASSF